MELEDRGTKNDRPWFKVSAAILDSRDLSRLSPLAERVFWRFSALNCRRGYGNVIYGTTADFAWDIRFTEVEIDSALHELSQPGTDGHPLIECFEGGIRIVKWESYQERTTSTERVRRSRNVTETLQQRSRNAIESEAEAEAERESESDARARERGKSRTAELALERCFHARNASDAKRKDLEKSDDAIAEVVRRMGGWSKMASELGSGTDPDPRGARAFMRHFGKACHELAQARRERRGKAA